MHTTSSGDLPEPKNKTGIKLNDEETEIDDMILDKKQMDALYSKNSMKRTGLKNAFHHWPMAIVPYEIDPAYGEFAYFQSRLFFEFHRLIVF